MLHQIGVGALGPVFRTYEPTRDRLVAVKVFRLDITPEQAAALAEELGRATEAGLFHESIVEPVAAGLEGTVAYRAEEYVAAESLDVAMRHYAPAALDKALPFITQLATAIDTARAAGVGHGALHPRDIFVTPDEARATGFGVVDALERLGLRAPVRRPYSPPERIAGKAWSTQADVFSLGAIAFELLTGRRPSGLGDQMGALSGANMGTHHDAIRAVLARAMNEDPASRYATAGAFASALGAAAGISAGIPAETSLLKSVAPVAEPAKAALEPEPAEPAIEKVVVAKPPAEKVAKEPPAAAASDVDSVEGESDDQAESQSLEEFVAEGESAAPIESPREAARKAIAARKRQPKPKPEIAKPAVFDLDLESAEPSLTAEPEPIPAPIISAAIPPIVHAVSETTRDGEEDDQPPAPAEAPASKDELPVSTAAPVATGDESVPFSVAALEDVDLWHLDPVTTNSAPVPPKDVEPEMPAATPALPDDDLRVEAPLRDTGDRVVAVDEFRAREAASARAEKTWPRSSSRPMPSIAPVSRGVPPPPAPAKLLETNDVALVEVDEPEPEPQRFAMMPIAIGLLLGLLLGYGPGYFVGWRQGAAETQAQAAQNTAQPRIDDAKPNAPLTTPGTSGQSQGRDYSDQSVTPSSGRATVPNVTPEPRQRVPPEVSSAVKVNPPPAPNPAPPKPAPSNTAAATPKPAAAAPRTSGTIVVKSSPAKAAVTVNGRWTGRTPLTLEDREFGEYVIRVVEPGYAIAREVFKLSAAAPSKTIDVALKPSDGAKPPAAGMRAPAPEPPKPGASATGSLFVDSRPQGARVILNGKPAGVTPLRLNVQPVGAYEVRLELADHQPWTTTARVVGGETARVTGSMERIR